MLPVLCVSIHIAQIQAPIVISFAVRATNQKHSRAYPAACRWLKLSGLISEQFAKLVVIKLFIKKMKS